MYTYIFLLLNSFIACEGFDISSVGFYIKNLIESRAALPTLEKDFIEAEAATITFLATNGPAAAGFADEDAYLNISQLVKKAGYDFEEHSVTTKDGYILALHRIPNKGGPVVFLSHGILLASDSFVVAGTKSATAFYLASKGYDVWLGNARGNKFSKRNLYISPADQPRFFNFTFHEIAIYDLPANIDYILKVTGRKKLNYVGYSQGNTSFFILCSMLPEYNKKINVMVALGPIAFFSRLFSPVLRIQYLLKVFRILMAIGQYDFLPSSQPLFQFCNTNNLFKFICVNGQYLTFGYDRGVFNYTNIPSITSHALSGCSAKQFDHYRQIVYSGRFRQYDFGEDGNIERYGMRYPPDYDLSKVTAPVALFYSKSDYWSSVVDVLQLRQNLPNVVDFHEAPYFGHLDYVFGRNINKYINKRLLQLIRNADDDGFNNSNSDINSDSESYINSDSKSYIDSDSKSYIDSNSYINSNNYIMNSNSFNNGNSYINRFLV